MKFTGAPGEIKLITLDPGHFHAALIQKFPYAQVDSNVRVYAPAGAELEAHQARIEGFNRRAENPTRWNSQVYTGPDFLEKMIAEKPGNVVVISGNNAKKIHYISACIGAGLHVLADKPMAIEPADFDRLRLVFDRAEKKGLLLYDIMTERYEITGILQKALAQVPELFGVLEKGTAEKPAVTKESVHHFFKLVSGKPLIRPAWFFDVKQQGEGIVDVSTHLVDLVFQTCFPEQVIDYEKNIRVLEARRRASELEPAQFRQVTGLPGYPEYLKKDVVKDSLLQIYSNGEIVFEINGVVAKVSVTWNYEAPKGAGDTHYSMLRGTKANLVIRQGPEQAYRPVLYVEPVDTSGSAIEETVLKQALADLETQYPGLGCERAGKAWKIIVPEKYNVGHEAHFAQVAKKYLQYLTQGKLPVWEVPNMLAKYFVTTRAYAQSRR
jgi:predicted dehydrogenase